MGPDYFSDEDDSSFVVDVPGLYHKPNFRTRIALGVVPALPAVAKLAAATALSTAVHKLTRLEQDTGIPLAPIARRWASEALSRPVDTFRGTASLIRLARGAATYDDLPRVVRLGKRITNFPEEPTPAGLLRPTRPPLPVKRFLNFTSAGRYVAQPVPPGFVTDVSNPFAPVSRPATPARLPTADSATPRTLLAAGLSTPAYMHKPWYYRRFETPSRNPATANARFRAHIDQYKYNTAADHLSRPMRYPARRYNTRLHFRRDAFGRRRRYYSFAFNRSGFHPFPGRTSPRRRRPRLRRIYRDSSWL